MTIENFSVSLEMSNSSPCNYLPKTNYQVSDKKHISDVIGEDWLYSWTPKVPVFISAQTGSGKNYFIRNTLIPGFLKQKTSEHDGKILILSNRTALNRQTKLLIAETIDKFSGRYDKKQVNKIKDFSDTGLDKLEDFGNVFICSYQRLLGNELLKHTYDFVVIDECHFFVSDAIFNQNTEDILNTIITNFKSAIRIYMSATPDAILTKIIEKEYPNTTVSDLSINANYTNDFTVHVNPDALPFFIKAHSNNSYNYSFHTNIYLNNFDLNGFKISTAHIADDMHRFRSYSYGQNTYQLKNDKIAWIYDTMRDYSFLNIKYLTMSSSSPISTIVDMIAENQKRNRNDKWLVFVSTKKQGTILEKELNNLFPKKNISNEPDFAAFISASSKMDSGSNSNTYNNIVNKECFDEQVLISTSVLDNGINISDPAVKNIIILNFNRPQFLQMLGRIRTQKESSINLYLNIPPVSDITAQLKTYQLILIDYLDFEYSSDSDKQKIHSRLLFSPSYTLNSCWDLNEDQTLCFNPLAKTSLLYSINSLKNVLRKIIPFQPNLTLIKNDHKKINFILSDVLEAQHKDLLFELYSKLPQDITQSISEELLYLPEESGEYIAAVLDTIPDLPKDHFIPDTWDFSSKDDLQKKIDTLIYTRYHNQPRKDISALEYSYLKKYQFLSNKINSIRDTSNEAFTNNETLSILIKDQKKYRVLFNYKRVKASDASSETMSNDDICILNIIKEQLSWLERLDAFNKENFYHTDQQKDSIGKEEENHQLLIQLIDKYAIPMDQYIEAKDFSSNENLPPSFLKKETQESFRSKFTEIYQKTFGKRSKDKVDTTSYGLKIINDCLKEKQLPYTIQSDNTDKKTTYWIIIKNK